MKLFTDPKQCMWFCRIVPVVFWILHIILCVLESAGQFQQPEGPLFLFVPWVIAAVVYVSFMWFFLPVLLFYGEYRSFPVPNPLWYFVLATLTCGIVPVLWYWVKIDPVLREMVLIKTLDAEQAELRKTIPVRPSVRGDRAG
jgi:hypothetical protein